MGRVTIRGGCSRPADRRVSPNARRAISAGTSTGTPRPADGRRAETCHREGACRLPFALVGCDLETAARRGCRSDHQQTPCGAAHAARGAASRSWALALDATSNDFIGGPWTARGTRRVSQLPRRGAGGRRDGGGSRRLCGALGASRLHRLRIERNAVIPSTDRRLDRITTFAMPG